MKFLDNETAEGTGDVVGKLIGLVFGVYIIAYALVTAILAAVNNSNTSGAGFASTSPVAPLLNTLFPIIIAIGIGWMLYKHVAVK